MLGKSACIQVYLYLYSWAYCLSILAMHCHGASVHVLPVTIHHYLQYIHVFALPGTYESPNNAASGS